MKVTVTATSGGQTAECVVYCKGSGTGTSSGGTGPSGTGSGTSTPGKVSPTTPGTIINAGSGLNIRSGPGSSYDVVASALNGAQVTILEDTGSGWYKINYGGSATGYVSSSYVSVGS